MSNDLERICLPSVGGGACPQLNGGLVHRVVHRVVHHRGVACHAPAHPGDSRRDGCHRSSPSRGSPPQAHRNSWSSRRFRNMDHSRRRAARILHIRPARQRAAVPPHTVSTRLRFEYSSSSPSAWLEHSLGSYRDVAIEVTFANAKLSRQQGSRLRSLPCAAQAVGGDCASP